MMMADTLASYGSLARYTDLQRIVPVGETALLGGSGEYSDFQEIQKVIGDVLTNDANEDDGSKLNAKELHSLLARILYNKRTKMNPFYNQLCIGGFVNGQTFLGLVDLYGSSFTDNFLATGYGGYLAIPILRNKWRPDMEEAEARELLSECMKVLYYRDARTINKFNIGRITPEGITVDAPISLPTEWSYRRFVDPHNARA